MDQQQQEENYDSEYSETCVSDDESPTNSGNEDDASTPVLSKHGTKRKVGKPRKDVTKEQIQELLHLPQQQAAAILRVSVSTLKRRYQEYFNTKNRWPAPSTRLQIARIRRQQELLQKLSFVHICHSKDIANIKHITNEDAIREAFANSLKPQERLPPPVPSPVAMDPFVTPSSSHYEQVSLPRTYYKPSSSKNFFAMHQLQAPHYYQQQVRSTPILPTPHHAKNPAAPVPNSTTLYNNQASNPVLRFQQQINEERHSMTQGIPSNRNIQQHSNNASSGAFQRLPPKQN